MPRPTLLTFFDASGWTEASQVPHREWQVAVANGDTEEGYMTFVVSRLRSAGRAFQFEDLDLEAEAISPAPSVSAEVIDRFPRPWWLDEVAALDTRRGYAAWAASQQKALEDEEALLAQADAGLELATSSPRPPAP